MVHITEPSDLSYHGSWELHIASTKFIERQDTYQFFLAWCIFNFDLEVINELCLLAEGLLPAISVMLIVGLKIHHSTSATNDKATPTTGNYLQKRWCYCLCIICWATSQKHTVVHFGFTQWYTHINLNHCNVHSAFCQLPYVKFW